MPGKQDAMVNRRTQIASPVGRHFSPSPLRALDTRRGPIALSGVQHEHPLTGYLRLCHHWTLIPSESLTCSL